MSNIIVKHRQGLVTDCHHLPMVPIVPIVPQSAPMVSVADVSVKLYLQEVRKYKKLLVNDCDYLNGLKLHSTINNFTTYYNSKQP